jgi:hypothetical protein
VLLIAAAVGCGAPSHPARSNKLMPMPAGKKFLTIRN